MGRALLTALGLLLAAHAHAQSQPQTPDPALVRNEINKVLGVYTKPAVAPSLGRIVEIGSLSIAYGAPTYNAGDIKGCGNFYEQSMDDIVEIWSGKAVDPDTAEALVILTETLERTRTLEGADRRAWALRHGWDRVSLLHSTELLEVQGLMGIAEQSMARSHYPEAVSAYAVAADKLDGLIGIEPRVIDVELRFAALALGHAKLGAQDFTGSSQAVARGLVLIPDWLSYGVDRSAHHPAGEHARLLTSLEAATRAAPTDLDLQFLLAYEYAMKGRDKEAMSALKTVLRKDEDHTGARILSAGLATR